jgi:hypothetical protein
MPKRTLALIIFLIAATVGLVTLSVYTKPVEKVTTPITTSTIPLYVQTTITLSDAITSASTFSGQFQTEATISTGTNKVTAVQLELSYDPKALSNVVITPGTFIKNPTVLLKKVDPKLGRISLAMGISLEGSGASGSGQIATITFTPNEGYKTTEIKFLPTTQVTAEETSKSVLKAATGATFIFEQPTTTTTAPLGE